MLYNNTIVGLFSSESDCASEDGDQFLLVFTNVSEFISYITSEMQYDFAAGVESSSVDAVNFDPQENLVKPSINLGSSF